VPFVVSSGHRLHYEVLDTAAPWHVDPVTILFHHGIGAESGIWADWVHALAGRYRLVRFDMRGFGRSEVPEVGFSWSIDLLARDVLAVADATQAQHFHFVGESIGGTIGLDTNLFSLLLIRCSGKSTRCRQQEASNDRPLVP